MSRYRHVAIGELCSELLYSPPEVRRLHVLRLESLLDELDATQQYPLEFIHYRLTGFASAGAPRAFTGAEVRPDLCLLLLHLSAGISDPAAEQAEPVLRLAEVARRCNVSLRTVHRWRREGLVARMFVFDGGSRHVAVREGALQRFLEAHPRRLHRRRPISRITARERDEILRRARELVAENGRTFSRIVRQIAAERGRARETIRYTLRRLEVGGGTDRIFPVRAPALNERGRRRILREYRSGTPVVELAQRYGRSRSAIYTALHQEGRREALEARIRYMPSAEFERAGAERTILGRAGLDLAGALPDAGIRPVQYANSLPDLSDFPVLTRELEADLFRRYNYLKYRMSLVQEEIARGRCARKQLDLFQRLRGAAEAVRRSLIRCNLRLVVAIARRHMGRLTNLSELTSIGNVALMRAVERFDYTRGNKFSTYAGWAITKQYARTIPEDNFRLATFITGHEEILLAKHGMPDESLERSDWLDHMRALLERGLERLNERERHVIRSRFGMGGVQPMTLEQLGAGLGLTRERIRQIEAAGLHKLRELLGGDAGNMLALQA